MPRCFFCFLLAVCTAAAQSSLTGPSLGLVYDGAEQVIRPILGIPGASTTGPHIDTGFTIANAAISPTQDFALAISTDGSLNLVTFSPTGPTIQRLNATAIPDRIVMSPTGSAAILYFRTANAIQIVSGMPAAVQVGQRRDISELPQAPDTFAISDDATVVLAGVPTGGQLFAIPTDNSAAPSIAHVQHASALTFFAKSHDALIADDAASTITWLTDAAGQSSPTWTFSDPALIKPDSVQAAPDHKTILAASATSGMLAIIDPSGTNKPTFLQCQCAPTELRPFKPAGIYQITEPSNGLLWILDSNPANPRPLFVPVPSDNNTHPPTHRPPTTRGSAQ